MKNALFLVLGLLSLAGCGPATTDLSRVKSPDGHWTAIAWSKQWSGPGNDFDATSVSLQQMGQPPFQILNFTHEYGTMKVHMGWTDNHNLNVSYGPSHRACDHVDLTFQAIRAADIEITTSPLPGGANLVRC